MFAASSFGTTRFPVSGSKRAFTCAFFLESVEIEVRVNHVVSPNEPQPGPSFCHFINTYSNYGSLVELINAARKVMVALAMVANPVRTHSFSMHLLL